MFDLVGRPEQPFIFKDASYLMVSSDPNAGLDLRFHWRTLPTNALIAMVHVMEPDQHVRDLRLRATLQKKRYSRLTLALDEEVTRHAPTGLVRSDISGKGEYFARKGNAEPHS